MALTDPELDRFKTEINLVDFAGSRGYAIDNRESWKGSIVMRSGGDKIIVSKRGANWGYYSVKNNSKGDVIDLVQFLDGCTLGEARKTLRAWSGAPPPPLLTERKNKTAFDDRKKTLQGVLQEWKKTRYQASVPYLITGAASTAGSAQPSPALITRSGLMPLVTTTLSFPTTTKQGKSVRL